MIKCTLKSKDGNPCRHEQGSVLVYALIVITFLSGLAVYLQTMSDPMIFQTKDTQQILSTEFLADSMENILSELCEKDTDFSGSKASTAGKKLLAYTINKYNTIRLFRSSTILIGEARIDGTVKESDVSVQDNWTAFATKQIYHVQYFNTIKTEKPLYIKARMTNN